MSDLRTLKKVLRMAPWPARIDSSRNTVHYIKKEGRMLNALLTEPLISIYLPLVYSRSKCINPPNNLRHPMLVYPMLTKEKEKTTYRAALIYNSKPLHTESKTFKQEFLQ